MADAYGCNDRFNVPVDVAPPAVHLVATDEHLYASAEPNGAPRGEWATIAEEIWQSSHRLSRLRRYASGCIRRCRIAGVELPVEPDDLVDAAMLVLLAGRVKLREVEAAMSRDELLDVILGRLLSTISNECKNLKRHQRTRSNTLIHNHAVRNTRDSDDKHLRQIDVSRAIGKLPERRRAVAEACLLKDQQPAAYAAAHGVSLKTVRNHVHLAKRSLKLDLGADYFCAS